MKLDRLNCVLIEFKLFSGADCLIIVCQPDRKEAAMLLEILLTQREAIQALGDRYGARHIRVFGSVARGEERPDSDVDLLVEFPRGYDIFAQRLPLTESLADLLGRRVELVPEHELNRHIRDQVLKEAVEL